MTQVTWDVGAARGHLRHGVLMAPPSFESHPAPRAPWSSATCNRSYVIAALRATAIAAVLLGVLALIVLF